MGDHEEGTHEVTQTAVAVCELCGEIPGPHCADKLCRACDQCAAKPGQPCDPMCIAPYGPGGPLEHVDDYGPKTDGTPCGDIPDRDWDAEPRIAAHPQVEEVLAALIEHGLPAEIAPGGSWTGWHLQIIGAGGITEIGAPEGLPEHGEEITGWRALHFDADDEFGDGPDDVYESEDGGTAPLVAAIVAYHARHALPVAHTEP